MYTEINNFPFRIAFQPNNKWKVSAKLSTAEQNLVSMAGGSRRLCRKEHDGKLCLTFFVKIFETILKTRIWLDIAILLNLTDPELKELRKSYKYRLGLCNYLRIWARHEWYSGIWIVLHVSTLCFLSLIVNSAWNEYREVPVVSVVDSDNYPSAKLQFPGVAICNINRISRKAANELAIEIMNANITNSSIDTVLNLIQQFGALYDTIGQRNSTSEKYLDELLTRYYEGDYDVTEIMKNLSPKCTDGLTSCYFQGVKKNCSELFTFRKTKDGFCCTFNYVREPDDIFNRTEDIKKDPLHRPYNISHHGITNGLSLVLEPFSNDYYFPMLPVTGWKITIFNSRNYPDNGSGSVSEALISPATETFLELDITSTFSGNDIRGVAIEKRKCIFKDEFPILYSLYTYSDCLVGCRAAAIWNICKCRPFFLPRRGSDEYNQKVCNTADAECVHSNKNIYWTVFTTKAEKEKNKTSSADLTHCRNCLPTCNDIRYYLRSSTNYLDRGIYQSELINSVELVDQSIVHIYFPKHGSIRLKQELAYYWYELLSNIGGICGVFIGFSLISIIEFLYFAFCTLGEFVRRDKKSIVTKKRTMRTTVTKSKDRTNEKRRDGTLYWNEFLSHSNVTRHEGRFHRMKAQRY